MRYLQYQNFSFSTINPLNKGGKMFKKIIIALVITVIGTIGNANGTIYQGFGENSKCLNLVLDRDSAIISYKEDQCQPLKALALSLKLNFKTLQILQQKNEFTTEKTKVGIFRFRKDGSKSCLMLLLNELVRTDNNLQLSNDNFTPHYFCTPNLPS